jgi:hypothetical protein
MRRILHAGSGLAAATILTLAAMLWSLLLLAREPALQRQRALQGEQESELRELERESATLDALRQPYEGTDRGADPERLARDLFGTGAAADIRLETVALHESFRLHTITVDYATVVFETLPARIRAAEALRPPLKLTACVLEAAPGKTGEGRARLTLERVERQ